MTMAKMINGCTGKKVIKCHAMKFPATGPATAKNGLIIFSFLNAFRRNSNFRVKQNRAGGL
jgi:hypothetical protein